jgi:hypothetical protein
MSIRNLSDSDAGAWFQSLQRSIFSINSYDVGSAELYEESGTGFIIEVFDTYAFALTAEHVVSRAVETAPEFKRDARLRYLGESDRKSGWQPTLKTHRYNAVFSIDGKLQTFQITESSSNDSDVSLVKLVKDPLGSNSDFSALKPLRLSTHLNPDNDLRLVGLEFDRESFETKKMEGSTFRMRNRARLVHRAGHLVSGPGNHSDKSALAKRDTFISGIPIEHGMSGSPIFHSPGNGLIIPSVCGAASADWRTVDGSSQVQSISSWIYNALLLRTGDNETLLDRLQQGRIEVHGIHPNCIAYKADENGTLTPTITLSAWPGHIGGKP